jgi:hypothetical protein
MPNAKLRIRTEEALRAARREPADTAPGILLLPFAYCLGRVLPIALIVAVFAFALPAAQTDSSAAGLVPPPQSVFVMPKRATEGKDPFFPNATRVYNTDVAVKPKVRVASVGDLSLKGISGTAAEPLAIINTTTFTTGEDNDVLTTAGRMRVRCVEINMVLGTVLVQVGGERRELRLQPTNKLSQ